MVRRADGFTLIELLLVVAIIGLVAAIAMPQLSRARMSAQEASAVGTLRSISMAEANFAASCGSGAYATDLADLAKPPAGAGPGFISPDVSVNGVQKSGYAFTLARNADPATQDVTRPTCNDADNDRATSFFASAVPTVSGSDLRYFATDTPASIYADDADIVNPIPPGTPTL